MSTEKYTIRQKVFKIFGDAFYIYNADGSVAGFCKQKFMRLREDIRIYTGEDQQTELFRIKARSILDFSTSYDVLLPEGDAIGSLRRKGLKSMFRDEWAIFSIDDQQIGIIREDSVGLALVRRVIPVISYLAPQKFEVLPTGADSQPIAAAVATFRTHLALFVYKLGIAIHDEQNEQFDDLMILAAGCLIAAIEGRQGSESSGSGLFSGG